MSEILQRNLCFYFGPVSIFRLKSGISADIAEMLSVLSGFKLVRNEGVSVPFQAPIQKILVLPAGTVRN